MLAFFLNDGLNRRNPLILHHLVILAILPFSPNSVWNGCNFLI